MPSAVLTDAPARRLPVWAMGLAITPMGFVFGFISTAMGILLAARGVSVGRVGAISAIAFSPTFWAFLLAPMVDVRLTKRAYAFFFAALAALLLGVSLLFIHDLTIFTATLTASCTAAVLFSTSVGGWLADVVTDAEYDTVSGWMNVANLGAAGVFSYTVIFLVRLLPLPVAAVMLGLLVMAPTVLLLYFPAPGQPSGRMRENFLAMTSSMRKVLREGRLWAGLVIFLSPIAFALTNLFSTMGRDFAAPENIVSALNGLAVAAACAAGCLLSIPLCRRFRRRNIYVLAGVGSAFAAVGMGLLPHTVAVYAVGLLVYNLFQGFNFTAFSALQLEIVGPRNALSGTMMAMLSASANVPISTMSWVDSHVHDRYSLRAMLFTDAGASVATAFLLMLVAFPLFDRYTRKKL